MRHAPFVLVVAALAAVPLVVTNNYYLDSINHTLLTAGLLGKMNLPVKGIIFNGPVNAESKQIILRHTGYNVLLDIEPESVVNAEMVRKYAGQIKL